MLPSKGSLARERRLGTNRGSAPKSLRDLHHSEKPLADRDSMGPRHEPCDVHDQRIRRPAPPASPGHGGADYNHCRSGCGPQWRRTPGRGPKSEAEDERDHKVGQPRWGEAVEEPVLEVDV